MLRFRESNMEPDWLVWARRIQALAQTGIAYTRDAYDRGRYEALRTLAPSISAARIVAPRAGAWIETMTPCALARADAWG